MIGLSISTAFLKDYPSLSLTCVYTVALPREVPLVEGDKSVALIGRIDLIDNSRFKLGERGRVPMGGRCCAEMVCRRGPERLFLAHSGYLDC